MCECIRLNQSWSVLFWPSQTREAVTVLLHSSQAEPQIDCRAQFRCQLEKATVDKDNNKGPSPRRQGFSQPYIADDEFPKLVT